MARRAIYGGSFDPPHVGHVLLVRYVLSVGLVDQVTVTPVFSHAFDKKMAPFGERLELARLAFQGAAEVEVSDLEQHLPRPSYTLNTVRALAARYPGDSFFLLMGSDVFRETPRWHRFEEVMRLAPPLVAHRLGESDAPAASLDSRGSASTRFLPPVLPRVASSEIRAWLAEAGPEDPRVQMFVPAEVRRVIAARGLYQSEASA